MKKIHGLYETKVYTKPANHSQVCSYCFKHLNKGDHLVKCIKGEAHNHFFYNYYHYGCYMIMLKKTFNIGRIFFKN